MTKLMNLNLQNAEILDKKEMKKVVGGATMQCMSDDECVSGLCENGMCGGNDGGGTCAWYNTVDESTYYKCHLSQAEAIKWLEDMGVGNWCCDSCAQYQWYILNCR